MTWSGPTSRDAYIYWPSQTTYQYLKNQRVYKTVRGTQRSETPYEIGLSFLDKASKWGITGSGNQYIACNQGGTQYVYGRVDNDYYNLSGRASNRARSRFLDAVKEHQTASIGAALGEWDSTLRMIGDRLSSLLKFASAVRQKRWKKAGQALGIRKGFVPKAKTVGGAWLEYHFGWSPLLGDIHAGMEVISAPIQAEGYARGRGKATYYQPLVTTLDNGFTRIRISGTFVSLYEIRGYAEMVNPNLDMLEQLGLVNPAAVAWELVPFSFLVDHVVGIGDFLNSFSDAIAWDLYQVATSYRRECRNGTTAYARYTGSAGNYTYGSDYGQVFAVRAFRTVGGLSLPPYVLSFTNPFTGLSAPRAATYCALLLQQLRD